MDKIIIIILVFFCNSVSANNIKKIPVISPADGHYHWQSENFNEYSTGTYCEEGVYAKRNKKFCKTRRKSKNGKIVCRIKEEEKVDKIMFCAQGNWAEIYQKKDDGTCITYIYI